MKVNDSDGKPPLLFLCHRIPYPPNKGDKIRAFHLLHHLSQHFKIYLATFVDDPADWPYLPDVEKFCEESLFLPLQPWRATINSLSGLFSREALSIPFYRSPKMKEWVKTAVAKHGIAHAIVYSSAMAQFVPRDAQQIKRKVIDFVDVDSDKWQQYSEQKPWPLSWVYSREARHLLKLEKRLAMEFDAGLFVSAAEADTFRQLAPATSHKIGYYNNGVNTAYFTPEDNHVDPYPSGAKTIVFTGAMDYWPNVDAVVWFAREVMPGLRALVPDVHFYIVGGKPAKSVMQLSSEPGVIVTGRVDDIRPYMHYAAVAVAPMRVARGVQNKVLEAMAMEKPVVVSRKGLEGIDASHGDQVLVAEQASDYVSVLFDLLTGSYADMGSTARSHVQRCFNWDENLPEVVLLLASSVELVGDNGEASMYD
jgi:sugar transferase (PEP-CTERM/EpsH1 system associated)